jgi:hypothetical protein
MIRNPRILVAGGIVVNDVMETAVPGLYADGVLPQTATRAHWRLQETFHCRTVTASDGRAAHLRFDRPRAGVHSTAPSSWCTSGGLGREGYRKRNEYRMFHDAQSSTLSPAPRGCQPANKRSMSVTPSSNTSRRALGPHACKSRAKSSAALVIRSDRPAAPC